ncbi:response regulator transcription factor [Chitinophagaceae bacterium MMS25-I14]
MKILVVEDEASVASLIKRGLTESGYEISVAPDGTTADQMIFTQEYDLFILDVMLPGINGIELCRKIRSAGMKHPVLMLTALGTTENIITGLNNGADDYLVKPFKFGELEARVRALLRRANPENDKSGVLVIADLEMNPAARTVKRAGNEIALTGTEYRLLECFLKNKGRVLSRMELLEQVWGVDFNMATNVVDVYVNYLRKKIDKDFDVRLIHTVTGMGYILKEGAA